MTKKPAVVLACLLVLAPAWAGRDLRVRVPFDFRAGGTRFAPGEYLLVRGDSLTIRSAADGRSVAVGAHRASDAGPEALPSISFRAYGERRFLSAIQLEGGERWEVTPSRDEAALAQTTPRPTVTSLRAEALAP